MSDHTLVFSSYLQSGLSYQADINVDEFGVPKELHPTVNAGVKISGSDRFINHSFPLRGPADVVKIDSEQILKTDPKANSGDFEPNFFPHIEFVSSGFPWLFSHGKVTKNGRLCPWFTLVVLKKDGNFTLSATKKGTKQAVTILENAGTLLPVAEELYAWTHVQAETLENGEEISFARMICPKRLDKNTAYQAFLVPCFEAGRLAGLGQDVTGATDGFAWAKETASLILPYYYSWNFQTGEADFEDLVRRLSPYQADETVGLHDLDISAPRGGLNLSDLNLDLKKGKRITVSFEGALISPVATTKTWHKQHKKVFDKALEKMLIMQKDTVPADRNAQNYNALEDDPVVSPPFYGRWQKNLSADIQRTSLPKWTEDINFNPVYRAMAGTGSQTIRKNQEKLMAEAWEHAYSADAVQQEIRHARFALGVGKSLHQKMSGMKDEAWLRMTTTVNAHIKDVNKTQTLKQSIEASELIPSGTAETGFRRFAKTQDKKLNFHAKLSGDKKLKTSSDKEVVVKCLTAAPSIKKLASTRPYKSLSVEKSFEASAITSTSTAASTSSRTLHRSRTIERATGPARVGIGRVKLGRTQAIDKNKLNSLNTKKLLPVSVVATAAPKPETVKTDINLRKIADQSRAKTHPYDTVGKDIYTRIEGVESPKTKTVQITKHVKTHFEFDRASYHDLQKMNPEFLLPGFGGIPENSVCLLQTNPKFVQSYLSGLNHEMSREFAWREYPADLDNTWFRKFWDYIDNPDQKDIKPISGWGQNMPLGSAHFFDSSKNDRENMVLLIKGDLLKYYPYTRIYAVKARWQKQKPDEQKDWDVIDHTRKQMKHNFVRVADLSKDENMRLPIFKGNIGKEAHFLGFNLTEKMLRGSTKVRDKDPGWFFVFEENMTEPRFGLDVAQDFTPKKRPANISDLSWGHFATDEAALSQLNFAPLVPGWNNKLKFNDGSIWGKNSADMAKITYQRAVRILIHADSLMAEE